MTSDPSRRPPTWAILLAFMLVYVTWGTTYLAIKIGVQWLPPALFGGTRITLAGLIILTYQALRGERVRLPGREIAGAALIGGFFFVGGNYLVALGQKWVDSGKAAVLIATTPLWTGLIEAVWPGGERLTLRGWLGLAIGFGGIIVLKWPELLAAGDAAFDPRPLVIIASALLWAFGSCLMVRMRRTGSPLTIAAYQMILGGTGQMVMGICLGEISDLHPGCINQESILAFCYLLVFGSLIGFMAYTWLVRNVSVTQAGTYAYVNPVIAIIVGWRFGKEEINGWIVAGMVVILAGVALVRGSRRSVSYRFVDEGAGQVECTTKKASDQNDRIVT